MDEFEEIPGFRGATRWYQRGGHFFVAHRSSGLSTYLRCHTHKCRVTWVLRAGKPGPIQREHGHDPTPWVRNRNNLFQALKRRASSEATALSAIYEEEADKYPDAVPYLLYESVVSSMRTWRRKAPSLDAPITLQSRGAPQDAPKRKPPKAPRHNTRKHSAASKDAVRKAIASKATSTPSASGDARTDPTLSARPSSEASASYINNELCVAVMTEPFEYMTQVQAEGIRLNIEKELRALLMADPDPSNPTAIHFRGKPHFAKGVLKTWCEDAFTLAWLKRIITNMTSPVPGTSLTVRPQAEIPKTALCMLFVPENTEDETPALLKLLTRQNPNLKINTWTLTHERQEPLGTCLFFHVPDSMVKTIKEQNRRVYYLMDSIYIRFADEGVASEEVTALSTATAPVVPGPELDPLSPRWSSSPPAMETVEEVGERASSPAAMETVEEVGERASSPAAMETVEEVGERASSPAMEVESIIKGPTQDPSMPGLTSDDDCFLLQVQSESSPVLHTVQFREGQWVQLPPP